MFNKSFWAMKQDLAHGHGIGFSLFGGQGVASGDKQAILDFNSALQKGVPPAKAWATTMSNASISAQNMTRDTLRAKGNLKELANGLQTTGVKAKFASAGMKALSIASNVLLSIGISFAIQGIISLFDKLIHAQENAVEKAREAAQATSEQAEKSSDAVNELFKLKKQLDDDTVSAEDLTKAFREQAKNIPGLRDDVKNLAGEYRDLAGAIDQATTSALENARNDAVANVNATGKALVKSANSVLSGDSTISLAPGYFDDDAFGKEAERLEKIISKNAKIGSQGLEIAIEVYEPKGDNAEDVYAYYQSLVELQDEIKALADGDVNSKLFDTTLYKQTSEAIKTVEEDIKSYTSAIQRLHEADAQLDLSNYIKTNDIATKEDFDSYIQGVNAGMIGMVDGKEASEEYKQVLISVANDAFPQFSSAAKTAGKDVNETMLSMSELKSASDNLKHLGTAFKELSDDGRISIETISEIEGVVGESIINWEDYEKILLNAKAGSTELNQAMSDLTYAMLEAQFGSIDLSKATEDEKIAIENKISSVLEEIGVTNADAVAHDYLAGAYDSVAVAAIRTQIQTNILNGTLSANISTLQATAIQAGITEESFKNLVAQIAIANTAQLGMEGVINTLIQVGYYASWAQSKIASIGSVKKHSVLGENYIATYDKDGKLMHVAEAYSQPETFNFQVPNFSGATGGGKGGGGGGSKDEPKQHDVTEAIIDRINLAHTQRKNVIETLKDNADLAESEKKYAEALQITNQLISEKTARITELETANSSLSKEAQKIRDANPWNEDEWFDSEGNATEAYYALLNQQTTGSAQDEIQKVFDTLSKFKEAYKNNAEEIRQINSDIIQDGETIQGIYQNMYDDYIRDVEHSRDLALESNPYEDVRPYYDKLQEAYHKEAERLRAIDPVRYADEIQELQRLWHDAQNEKLNWRWENSQNWIDQRNAFGDWDLFNDSEVKAWERIVKWVREEYPNDLDKIKEAERSLFEARKKEINEELNLQMSKLASLKTLLQSHYDVTNSIVEAQHEIDKELEASKTMYEYLDKSTRELLFNQEDYNELTAELAILQTEANNLQARYNRDILSATAENLDEITSQYQIQYETMMKQYEIAKAELDIAKKRQQLNNVLNEKNVRMLVNGRWTWVADADDVVKAQSELADAEYAKQTSENTLKQAQAINEITTTEKVLNTTLNNIDKGFIGLESSVSDLTDAFDDINTDGILSLKSIIGNIESAGAAYINAINSDDYSGEYKKPSKTSNVDSLAVVYASQDYSQGIYNDLAKGDIASAKKKNELRNQKIDYLGLKVDKWDDKYIEKLANGGHANGTKYSPGGWKKLGEDGSEFLISPEGQLIPINQPMIGHLDSGSIVFNQSQLKNLRSLWDLSNLNMVSHSNLISKSQPISGDTNCNNIVINGMVIEEKGNEDWISGFKRYVATHKH